MNIDLLKGTPPLIMMDVRDGRTSDEHVADVTFAPPAYQPVITSDETELARFVGEATLGIGVTEDGSRDLAGKEFGLVKAPFLVGVIVFTDRRLVFTSAGGEFFGGMRFDSDKSGNVLLFEIPYQQVGSVELEMKQKAFGGEKPVGLFIHVRNPHLGILRFKPKASTTVDNRPSRDFDLAGVFRSVCSTVAEHSRPYVYPEAAKAIDEFLASGPKREDGNLLALFEPDDWAGPAPIVTLPQGSAAAPVEQPTSGAHGRSTPSHSGTRLAKFCQECGQGFEEDEAFCTSCGAQRRSKSQ